MSTKVQLQTSMGEITIELDVRAVEQVPAATEAATATA